MIRILQDYFRAMRIELALWRRVAVALYQAVPLAVILAVRERCGLILLRGSLRVLPSASSAHEVIMRSMIEQRAYDRYTAFAEITGEQPLSFERWRNQSQWIFAKARMMVA